MARNAVRRILASRPSPSEAAGFRSPPDRRNPRVLRGGQLDRSLLSRILALAFSMAAGIGRDLISQRAKEALRARKAQGLRLGRSRGPGRSKLDAFRPGIEGLPANGSTQRFIAQRHHATEANLHNWLKKHGLRTARSSAST